MSQAAAAWIAQASFWVLLAIGAVSGELNRRRIAVFVALWIAGYFGLPRISPFSGLLVTSYVAVLDIALVFVVLKGDIQIS